MISRREFLASVAGLIVRPQPPYRWRTMLSPPIATIDPATCAYWRSQGSQSAMALDLMLTQKLFNQCQKGNWLQP